MVLLPSFLGTRCREFGVKIPHEKRTAFMLEAARPLLRTLIDEGKIRNWSFLSAGTLDFQIGFKNREADFGEEVALRLESVFPAWDASWRTVPIPLNPQNRFGNQRGLALARRYLFAQSEWSCDLLDLVATSETFSTDHAAVVSILFLMDRFRIDAVTAAPSLERWFTYFSRNVARELNVSEEDLRNSLTAKAEQLIQAENPLAVLAKKIVQEGWSDALDKDAREVFEAHSTLLGKIGESTRRNRDRSVMSEPWDLVFFRSHVHWQIINLQSGALKELLFVELARLSFAA